MINTIDLTIRKSQLIGILETICQELELSETQRENAESKYQAVGNWLASSDDALLQNAQIYSQGSFSIETSVKPLGREEYDLDFVCLVPKLSPQVPPSYLKKLIGGRLRENEKYRDMLEEKARCWRITYANEFHLDVTPSIYNPMCGRGGELVPDKKINEWKPSNPKGYRIWFEERARLRPRFLLLESPLAKAQQQIESLPGPTSFKGFLPRIVQLCKRHRDIHFDQRESEFLPISIILTTLIANSYAHCAANFTVENEFDLLLEVLRHAEDFIETRVKDGNVCHYVWNDTTANENFAEKWNQDSRFAQGFFSWHKQALIDFERLPLVSGRDQIKQYLSPVFGENIVSKALTSLTTAVSSHRAKGTLAVAAGVGLASYRPKTVVVRPNTFYGA